MLSQQMIKILEKQRLGFVATVDEGGRPCLSPKGTFVVVSQDKIAFGDIRSPRTSKNIAQDPRVEVNFVDPLARRGFRARGTAEILERGTLEFDVLIGSFDRWSSLSNRIKRIVQICVSEAKLVETPAYDDGATEDELRQAWRKTLLGDT